MKLRKIFLKIWRLIKNPIVGFKKVYSFLYLKWFRNRHHICEFFGLSFYSRPYLHHKKILKYLNKKSGFFVECGGNDGFFQDPTYYLEKFKSWTGVIIEPLPIYKLCQKNRPNSFVYNLALTSPDKNGSILEINDCGAMSTVDDGGLESKEWVKGAEGLLNFKSHKISIKARTLDFILEDYFIKNGNKEIDLLVMDVENYEWEVLQGFSFMKYKPKFILIEIHKDYRLKQIKDYLSEGYDLIDDLGLNDYLFKLKA